MNINLPDEIITNDTNSFNSPRNKNRNKSLPIVESVIITLIENNLHVSSFALTDDEKQWIQLIIKNSPSSFEEIDQFLDPILSSEQLNIEIIPKFIKVLVDTYTSISQQNNILDQDNIYTLIKFTVDVVIDFIPSSSLEIIIIKSVVDSSLSLLKTSIIKGDENNISSTNNEQIEIDMNMDMDMNIDVSPVPEAVGPEAVVPEAVGPEILSGTKKNWCWKFKLF